MSELQLTSGEDSLTPVRRSWVRWRLVLILMGFAGLSHFHRQSLPSVVQQIMRDWVEAQSEEQKEMRNTLEKIADALRKREMN